MNKTDLKKEKLKEFREKFNQVEFLHGVPVSMPVDTQKELEQFLSDTIDQTRKEAYDQGWNDRWEHEKQELIKLIDKKLG